MTQVDSAYTDLRRTLAVASDNTTPLDGSGGVPEEIYLIATLPRETRKVTYGKWRNSQFQNWVIASVEY